MKKTLFVVALMAMFSMSLAAQNGSVLVKGAMNASSFTGSDASDMSNLIGGRFGLGVDMPLVGNLSVQPTVYLSQKGSKWSGITNVSATYHAWYVDMPVNLQYRFGVTDRFDLLLAAGPYVSYGVFGKVNSDIAGLKSDADTFSDGYLKKFDWGANGEIAIELDKTVQLNFGYQYGLYKIFDNDKDSKIFNSNIFVGLGYRF